MKISSILKEGKQFINRFDSKYPPLSSLNPIVKVFDFIVFLLMVFNAIYIPMKICFAEEIKESSLSSFGDVLLSYVSPILFLIDVVRHLNTNCFIRG